MNPNITIIDAIRSGRKAGKRLAEEARQTCPPCTGSCDQGRLCVAEDELDFDPLGAAKGIILALLITLACAFVGWACVDVAKGLLS